MFDLATRPVPATALQLEPGVAFDLRLTPRAAAENITVTDYGNLSTGSAVPTVYPVQSYAIALEDTLQTALILSLFSDARWRDGDGPKPPGRDLRGWVGDDFQAAGDAFGGLLWVVLSSKVDDDTPRLAEFYAGEALAWMVRDRLAERVVVEASWVDDRLAIRPQIYQAGRANPVYDVLWGTTLRRGAA